MSEALSISVDYQPAASGPFLWQAFDAATVTGDLAAIAAQGFRTVRLGLAWDSFMPDARRVDRRRLAELDAVLRACAENGLQLVPVLFLQAHGDCVLLPRRAVRRDGARNGVRVLSDGFLEPGRPRDPWTDPLMLELADRWAREMATELAGHPAIAAWDLGEDPAAVARPRRISDLAAWVALAGGPFRDRGDRVRLTLGCDDLMTARGVRLAAVAPGVDAIDLAVRPEPLRRLGLADASAPRFLAELAQRMVGEVEVPVGLALALPSPGDGGEGLDEPRAAAVVDQMVARRDESGISALRAVRWTDLRPRLAERAPFDRAPWMLRCGLLREDGAEKPLLLPWSRSARAEPERPRPCPWPARLDVESYYANLPESLLDLAAAWRREQDDEPAILEAGEA
jgi:hypothetical protein